MNKRLFANKLQNFLMIGMLAKSGVVCGVGVNRKILG